MLPDIASRLNLNRRRERSRFRIISGIFQGCAKDLGFGQADGQESK
jgi:hypothetical protein